jgi:hypothetical protein
MASTTATWTVARVKPGVGFGLGTPVVGVAFAGILAAQRRASVNHELVLLSWYYVIGLVSVFLVAAGSGCYRRLPIPWRRLLLENCGLVFLLGLFEGLFFTTIVYPYLPVTSQEIAASTVSQLRTTCFGEPSS